MKNKKSIILTSVAVVTLLALVVGATFAYFTAGGGASTSANVKVETSNQDILTFVVGDPINIEATQTTFASVKGNASGNTTAKAILKTANDENELKANYYLYLNISKNEFSYTTEDNTAELLLKITDPSGNQVTSLDGLTYKTLTDGSNTSQSGFDITTKSGLITIANNKEIKAKPETTEEWKVEIVFVNLDEDQSGNAGKSLTAKLLIQKEEYDNSLATYIKSQYTGTQGANGIYLHNSSLTNGAGDNSYRYTGEAHSSYYTCTYNGNNVYNSETNKYDMSLDECSKIYKITTQGEDTYYFNSTFEDYNPIVSESVTWDETNEMCVTSNTNDKVYDYDDESIHDSSFCKGKAYHSNNTYSYIIGVEELGAGSAAYHNATPDIDNYVCFGSNETPCPNDNLYRIIGVFGNNVKLIKYDYATSAQLGESEAYDGLYDSPNDFIYYRGSNYSNIGAYWWGSGGGNVWSRSALNTTNLNITYLTNLGTTWANKIATATWQVGGNTYENIVKSPLNTVYQNEIVSPAESITYQAKIGLMYVSDYGYAASPTYWTHYGYYGYYLTDSSKDYRAAVNENWIHMGLSECLG